MDDQNDALHSQHGLQDWQFVKVCDSWSDGKKQSVEQNGENQIPIKYSRIVKLGRFLFLDEGGTQPTLDEDVGDGEEDGEHSDAVEIRRHQQTRQHEVGEEIDGEGPHLSHSTPHHAGNRFVLQIVSCSHLFWGVSSLFPFGEGSEILESRCQLPFVQNGGALDDLRFAPFQ